MLDMSPHVYHKQSSPKVRPTTLSIDASARLVGGRKSENSTSSRYIQCTCYFILLLFSSRSLVSHGSIDYLNENKCLKMTRKYSKIGILASVSRGHHEKTKNP